MMTTFVGPTLAFLKSFRLSSAQQESLKWLALLSMFVDHIGAILLQGSSFYWAFRSVGRIAFPLFAFLVAYNLVVRGASSQKYLINLLVAGVVAQIPYMWVFGVSRFNIMFTLFLAVVPYHFRANKPRLIIAALSVMAVLIEFNVDYGIYGVLLILGFMVALARPAWWSLFTLPVLVFVVNGFQPLALAGLVALPLIVGVRYVNFRSHIRVPKWFFYIFYPAHLLLLKFITV